MESTLLAPQAQRASFVEGGSLPGITLGPITPPSKRMVR